jgi:hypothetical protein
MIKAISIGWDVGGWNCDKNGKSRDAVVILDDEKEMVGQPWRGNLRESIIGATSADNWLKDLFAKCEAEFPTGRPAVTLAIDTPLGFSEEFVALVTGRGVTEPNAMSGLNRYLFRHTERRLFDSETKEGPLSAVKDMIGSQATKGMHALAKFAPKIESCGVWTNGDGFRAVETYPTACRNAPAVKRLLKGKRKLENDDLEDARVCAVMAWLFAHERATLEEPGPEVPDCEGWIWVPKERS